MQTKRVQTPMGPRGSIIIGKGMAEQILGSPDVAKALAQGYGLRRPGR